MEHLHAWQGFASADPERNRHAGGTAHNRTLDYIWAHLSALCNYYALESQPFHSMVRVSGAAALYRVDEGRGIHGAAVTYPPRGVYTGDVVLVENGGCEAVSSLLSLLACYFGFSSSDIYPLLERMHGSLLVGEGGACFEERRGRQTKGQYQFLLMMMGYRPISPPRPGTTLS